MTATLPMLPSLFDQAIEAVATDAERRLMDGRQAAGLEFAYLMETGGRVRHGGEWCEITAVAPGANGGVLLTLADGREVAAALLAQRRYEGPDAAAQAGAR